MPLVPQLLRSVLYVPASKERAVAKAETLDADAIIYDLEDAVATDAKASARSALSAALKGDGATMRLVRVNGLETPWGRDDLRETQSMACNAVLLPKVDGPGDVKDAADLMDKPVWCMIETARGVIDAPAIATHPRVKGFVLGTNDLARELGAETGKRAAVHMALQSVLLAARAAGIACIDGVFNAFRDEEGLREECREARAFGMDGKSLIHPAQISIANKIFAPTEAEVDLARRQIAAWQEAEARAEAVAVVDGRIVEALHVATARATLARAEAIGGRTP